MTQEPELSTRKTWKQRTRPAATEQTSSALEALGDEPLAGSGFEQETPEPGFSPARQNPAQG